MFLSASRATHIAWFLAVTLLSSSIDRVLAILPDVHAPAEVTLRPYIFIFVRDFYLLLVLKLYP